MDNKDYLDSLWLWLDLKSLEFSELGYDSVSVEDLSNYLTNYLWKREVPTNKFEKIYQIMQIKPNEYWDFESVEAQVTKVKSLDQMDFSELF